MTIRRGSSRTLANACALAGIAFDPHAIDEAGLGRLFLELLVRGVDHEFVGTRGWREAMLFRAPIEPAPPRDQRR